jgi:hypothetical protein
VANRGRPTRSSATSTVALAIIFILKADNNLHALVPTRNPQTFTKQQSAKRHFLVQRRGVNGSGQVTLFYYFFIQSELGPIKFGSKFFDPYLTRQVTGRPDPTCVK